MPDDPPIRYPSPTAWQELTARRRAAYGSAGAARRSPAEEQIEQALRSPVEVQFDQVPLAKAVAELKDLAGVEMQLDELAIYAAGIAPDTPVSVRLRGISLKSVLNLMLRDLGLTHVVENEMILITSQQAARTKTQIRVYYVGDLLRR
jgi:general secretion pathway protein D